MTPGERARIAAAVDACLRRLAELSVEPPAGVPLVDLSPDAVSARLRDCAEVSALALELMAAGQRG